VFGALAAGTVVTGVVRAVLCFKLLLASSQSIHMKMFRVRTRARAVATRRAGT
jgi:hypothetical protein